MPELESDKFSTEYSVIYDRLGISKLSGAEIRPLVDELYCVDEDLAFDPYHDPGNAALDCTEYLSYLLVDRAGYPFEYPLRAGTEQPSARRARRSLGFRVPAFLVPDDLAAVPGARRTAVVSRHASPSRQLALTEAVRLLHGRFGPESRLGDYLGPHPFRLLRYRRNVVAFLEYTKGYFGARPTADPAEIRRVLEELYAVFFVER